MIAEQTVRYQFPLPHPANTLAEDVIRLRAALGGVDGILYSAQTQLGASLDTQTHWADATAVTYNDAGQVATITETYGVLTYTTTLTYTNDLVTRVQQDGNGLSRVETLTYDAQERLTGVTATEAPL